MIVRRSLLAVFVIFAAATINFWLPRTTGRDPIAERLAQIMAEGGGAQMDMTPLIETYQRKFGLDQPLWQQYATYLWDTANLDWGYSISSYPTRVSTLIAEALPWTIGLMLVSTIVAFVVGSLVGAYAAWRGNLKLIQVFMPALMLTAGIPYYLIGLILIYFLAFRLGWFPIGGGAPIGAIPSMSWDYAVSVIYHAILPAASIVIAAIGFWALGMRAMMTTVIGQDFILFAEAKGLSPWRIFFKYGFRNALLPQVTTLALVFGQLVTGAVLVEMVFGYPGLGSLLFISVSGADFPTVYGVVVVLAITVALSMALIDLMYPLLDPRVRLGSEKS